MSLVNIMTVMLIEVESASKKILFDILPRLQTPGLLPNQFRDELLTKDDNGDTAVHWAARFGHCKALEPVLTPEVVNVANKFSVTPLHEAADTGLEQVQV